MNKLIREFPRALFISILIFIVLTIIPVNGGEVNFNNHLKLISYTPYFMGWRYITWMHTFYVDSVFINNRYAVKG
jgi:hypothetical protein